MVPRHVPRHREVAASHRFRDREAGAVLDALVISHKLARVARGVNVDRGTDEQPRFGDDAVIHKRLERRGELLVAAELDQPDVGRRADLFQVALALGLSGLLARAAESGQKHAGQDGDDGQDDDHETGHRDPGGRQAAPLETPLAVVDRREPADAEDDSHEGRQPAREQAQNPQDERRDRQARRLCLDRRRRKGRHVRGQRRAIGSLLRHRSLLSRRRRSMDSSSGSPDGDKLERVSRGKSNAERQTNLQ